MCRTHGETHRHVCKHRHRCALWILHLFWVSDWSGQNTLGEAWLLREPISQTSRCSKKNTAADSDLCLFMAWELLGHVAAGYFWGVRQSSSQSSCSCWPLCLNLAEPSLVGGCVSPHWYFKPASFCYLLWPGWPWLGLKAKQWRYQQQRHICISRKWFSDAIVSKADFNWILPNFMFFSWIIGQRLSQCFNSMRRSIAIEFQELQLLISHLFHCPS